MDSAAAPTSEASGANPRKRKHSVINEAGEERIVKHRSSKACRSCRTRKVRCDVSAKGARCTNCELDNLECIVLPSRRGQSNRIRRDDTAPVAQLHNAGHVDGRRDHIPMVSSATRAIEPQRPATASEDTSHVPAVVTFEEEADDTEEERRTSTAANGWRDAPYTAHETLLTPETRTDTAPQHQSSPGNLSLPTFIAPIPTRILPEDSEYLSRKGAFVVPEPDLCVEILRAYLFSVHPFMPMLNVNPFVRALQADGGQISLLLFQAVMFAGLHSLHPDVVQRLGFQSPKQAREIFFNRVRLLYDFNVESDNTAILQSLILMSSWYSKHTPWNERRHTWHWTGLAYDLARSIGLHREPTGEHLPAEVRRFRRRLWWSLYIRDRMIALGTRRPMRIEDDEFDVAMLSLDDFEIPAPEDHTQDLGLVLSNEEATWLALMCVQLARLGIIIGHVAASQYTTLGTQAGASHTTMVMPRRDGDHTAELEECEGQLSEWIGRLPGHVQRSEWPAAQRDPHSCTDIHWAQLNMTYLTVVNVLHRAQALQSQTAGRREPCPSRSKVKNAARSITRLGQEMLQHDQVRFLGLIGVTAILAACLTHMLDVGSADEDVRDASTFRLYQSLQVLGSLREIYASADSAFAFLASVTRKAGIYLPTQANGPATAFTSSPPSNLQRTASQPFSRTTSNGTLVAGQSVPRTERDSRWQISNFRFPSQSADDQAHAGAQSATGKQNPLAGSSFPPGMTGGRQSSYMMASPTPIPAPGVDGGYQNAANGVGYAQFASTNTGGFHNMAPDGNILSWDAGLDAGGFGSMPFTYDFFSDAFGFMDSDMHGL